MAFFRFAVRSVSRGAVGDGRSATAAAAYRAGERIRDERTGKLHNYSRRRDVTHRQILLPSRLPEGAGKWALDRARLWNAAEHAESRRNSRVAREYQLSLPHELDAGQRLALAQGFAREIADRHNVIVDLCIHDPKPGSDPRNYHAHLLATTREVGPDGLGAKAGIELRHPDSLARGLLGAEEIRHLRHRWAALSNEAYRAAGLDLRVDPRTLAERGLEPSSARKSFIECQIERRRMRREMAAELAERYRERVTASQASTLEQPLSLQPTGLPGQGPSAGSDLIEQARQRGREAWRALRNECKPDVASTADAARAEQRKREEPARALDDDQAL
jgi:ATP-dependent exoDNAse (exonuclease V) alpha subunit